MKQPDFESNFFRLDAGLYAAKNGIIKLCAVVTVVILDLIYAKVFKRR